MLAAELNPVQIENSKPGTTDWQLTNPVSVPDVNEQIRTPILEGFASTTSVNIGESISFYVSTRSPSYSLKIYRLGCYPDAKHPGQIDHAFGGREMPGASWDDLKGIDQPYPNNAARDCDWKEAELSGHPSFKIPTDWVSGVYVAKLTERARGKQSYILFTVRDDQRPASFLMQLSVNTYQAYNGWGGDSYYGRFKADGKQVTMDAPSFDLRSLSFNRPYLPSRGHDPARGLSGDFGTGAGQFLTMDHPYPRTRNGQMEGIYSVSGWEYNLVRWLEFNGRDVTYCTNVDLEVNPRILDRRKVLLSVGHDEYWSIEARNNIESAIEQGTSVAFLTGNTAWNGVRLDADQHGRPHRTLTVVCNFGHDDPKPISHILWPENPLLGGGWAGVDYFERGDNMIVTTTCPEWLKRDTRVEPGKAMGDRLGGYETQGLMRSRPTFERFSPRNMELFLEHLYGGAGNKAQGICYEAESKATVVSFGSIQWSWGLDDFCMESWKTTDVQPRKGPAKNHDGRGNRAIHAVRQMTENALARCEQSARPGSPPIRQPVPPIRRPLGEQGIQSLSAAPQWLHARRDKPALGGLYRTDDSPFTARWLLAAHSPPIGFTPPSAPKGPLTDCGWYRIRGKETGQSLIVGENGRLDGPVIMIGDAQGNWGQGPENTQLMWRLWRFRVSNVFVFQHANGQLLIVGENGRINGSVRVIGANGHWGEAEANLQKLWVLFMRPPVNSLFE